MSRRLRKNGMQGCECCLLSVGLNQVYSCVSFDAVFLVTAVVASKWSLCAVAAVYSLHTLVVQDRCSTVLVPIVCLLLKKTLLQLFSSENPSASLLLAALASTVLLLIFATFFLTLHLSSWKTDFQGKKKETKNYCTPSLTCTGNSCGTQSAFAGRSAPLVWTNVYIYCTCTFIFSGTQFTTHTYTIKNKINVTCLFQTIPNDVTSEAIKIARPTEITRQFYIEWA